MTYPHEGLTETRGVSLISLGFAVLAPFVELTEHQVAQTCPENCCHCVGDGLLVFEILLFCFETLLELGLLALKLLLILLPFFLRVER